MEKVDVATSSSTWPLEVVAPSKEADHLTEMVQEAVQRFAEEDGCDPAEWAWRAVRSVATKRLSMEATIDGFDTLSAQRRLAE